MKNTFKRIFVVSTASILGIVLVLFFIFIGKKSTGPLSEALDQLGQLVIDIEQDFLLSQRVPVRKKSLSWLEEYRTDINKLKNPDTILFGVYDNLYEKSLNNIVTFDDNMGFSMPIIHIYTAWGDKEREKFPMVYAKAIRNLGSIPMITWEPWLNDFDRESHQLSPVENPNLEGMKAIANGDYDFYIEKWTQDIITYGDPVFIRFGHEMNDPYRYPWGPQNNSPEDFIAAWKHVVDVFQDYNVDNVIWVWAPHPAHLHYKEYYPGNDYVDWVGVGALNYGTVASWSKWWSFDEIFGNYYQWLDMIDKPQMITELGSLKVGGDRLKWFANTFDRLPAKYPRIKALVFFNNSNDYITLNKSLDWSIKNDTLTCRAIKATIDSTWSID